jgi:ribonuclease Z
VDLDIVFLGTAGSMPTAQRSPAALMIRRGGERLLFDCAEGTQRQLLRSSVGLVDLHEVFLTHFHADHVLGLPGMLKTFALRGRDQPLEVYGPRGLVDLIGSLRRVVGKLTYEVRLVELSPGDVLERDGYRLATFAVAHGVSALGWSLIEATRPGRFDVEAADALGVPSGPERGALQRGEPISLPDGRIVEPKQVLGPPRPGRKIVITGDTAPSGVVVEAAWGSDVLITEATFSDEERDRAEETKHQTATQAADAARRADVRLLALTHLSNRYFGPEIAREAQALFADTVVPRDLDVVVVPYTERGKPHLVKGGANRRREAPASHAEGNAGAALQHRAGGRIIDAVAEMVRVAVAGDVSEAEEIQGILRSAGIESHLADGEDDSVIVSVPESSVEQAQDAIEAMTEPDDLVGEP